MGAENIKRLFVLMLENRSFDNLLGWSDLRGTDIEGNPTQADTLVGKPAITNYTVDPNDKTKTIAHPLGTDALYQLTFDPGHEFSDVVVQLCHDNLGDLKVDCINDVVTLPGSVYPQMVAAPNDLGFAECFQRHGFPVEDAFCCFAKEQLPVINFLASQFAVCDRWFSSVPGPTLPNRFFTLAGTSWDIDYSPDNLEVVTASFFNKKFGDGRSIFTSLSLNEWLVVYGDTPVSWSIKGTVANDHRFVRQMDFFMSMRFGDIEDSVKFVFIEPNYSPLNGFKGGESMHPKGDVRNGEALIKEVYEAFRDSKYWNDSALLITFDEHGGFFDHVIPDSTIPFPPLQPTTPGTKHGFRFDRYGVRVPSIIISPYVRQATIDHTVYDHLSIVKTLQKIARPAGASPLFSSPRLNGANDFTGVFTLDVPRDKGKIPQCPNPMPLDAPEPPDNGATASFMASMPGPGDSGGG